MTISFPHIYQPNSYTCWPTSVKMLLEYYGVHATIPSLAESLACHPQRGVENDMICHEFLGRGFTLSSQKNNSLQSLYTAVSHGHPVLVNYYNHREQVGHFAVVRGFSLEENILSLADPRFWSDHRISFQDFESSWHDSTWRIRNWAMILQDTPPWNT